MNSNPISTEEKGSRTRWLCIIGASKSHVPFIEAAHRLGLETLVFDRDTNAPGAKLATRFDPISAHDVDGLVSACKAATQSVELSGCMTYVSHERALMAAATVADTLGFPGFGVTAVENTSSKDRTKACLMQAQIPTPESGIIRSEAELYEFLAQHKLAILKPALGGTGSAGVVLVSIGDQKNGLALRQAQQESANGEVIAQVYHSGQEYSVDGYVQKGKATILSVAHKFSLGPEHHFVIEGFATGRFGERASDENKETMAELVDLGQRVVAALEIDNSFFNIDVVVGKHDPIVVDVGLFMDAKIDRLLHFSGLDVYELRCRLAIDQESGGYRDWAAFERGYALRFLYADGMGKLNLGQEVNARFAGNGSCRMTVEWEWNSGELVGPPESVADVIGWLIVEADHRFAAWDVASNQQSRELFAVEAVN